MGSLNKVMLIGYTGRDAEMRYLSTGTAKTDFSLAVSRRARSQSGEWEDQTDWFNVVMFGDMAERLSQYINKGKQLYVEGRLTTRSWDDDQGQRHYRTEVIANNIQFLDRRSGGSDGDDGWGDGASSNRGGTYAARGGAGASDIDDLPFE
jgi:single-strand DNA-binding protein